MSISTQPMAKSPRWLHTLVLVSMLVLVPLGVLRAQDTNYDAVGRRLQAAVAAGELTGAQARIMLGALRKTGAKKDPGADRMKAYLTGVKKELGQAVKTGRISKEEAATRYASAVKGIKIRMAGRPVEKKARGKKGKQPDKASAYLAKVRKEIGAAVRAGKMSREDAGKKYAAAEKSVKKKMAATRRKEKGARGKKGKQPDKASAYLAKVKKELGAMVKAGKISKEAAAKRYEGAKRSLKNKMAQGERRSKAADPKKRDTLRQIAADLESIKKALRSGKLSPKDADLKMRQISRRMNAIQRSGKQRERSRR